MDNFIILKEKVKEYDSSIDFTKLMFQIYNFRRKLISNRESVKRGDVEHLIEYDKLITLFDYLNELSSKSKSDFFVKSDTHLIENYLCDEISDETIEILIERC